MKTREMRQRELEELYKSEGGKERIHALYHEKVPGHEHHNDEREPTCSEMIGPILDAEYPRHEEVGV